MSEFKEVELPPRETWEAGMQQAVLVAEKFLSVYDTEKKILEVHADQRGAGFATVEEVKLSVGMLVAKRMVIEAQADLLHNSMACERAKRFIMSHSGIPKTEKIKVVQALAVKEGCGIKLAHGWRTLEQGLKKWQNKDYWINKQPEVEARKLLLAALGLQEVPVGNKDKGEIEGSTTGSSAGGLEESEGGAGHQDQALGQGEGTPGEEGSPRSEDPGRAAGRAGRAHQDVQGVQEASGQEDQRPEGADQPPAS